VQVEIKNLAKTITLNLLNLALSVPQFPGNHKRIPSEHQILGRIIFNLGFLGLKRVKLGDFIFSFFYFCGGSYV